MPEKRRIFVAGQHGQVAQAIGRECVSRGHAVHLAGRAVFNIADRASVSGVVSAFHPDLIVNAAAYTAVDKAEDEAEQAFLVNRDGALNVAVAASAAGVPLIHISTDYVYDGRKSSAYVETDQPRPLGVYGASKLAGELAITTLGMNAVILRTSWVCSPDGSNFLKTMLRLAGQRDEIGVVDDQWGSPTFAADLARVIVAIAEILLSSNERPGFAGVYHAANAGETTWCRFASAIMRGSADRGGPSCRVRGITTSEYPTRVQRPANSRLDCSKLAQVFGVRLQDWQDSLNACLDQMHAASKRVPT